MQTPTWTKRFEPGQIKLLVIGAVAIAILLLGALLSESLMSSDQTAISERTQNDIVRATPNTRFVERNVLPGAPGTYPVTSLREYRFHDWNILPGDSGAAASALISQQEYRFLDRNVLPGDDALLLPPDGKRGSRH